jgi:CIC family chloride channel protein
MKPSTRLYDKFKMTESLFMLAVAVVVGAIGGLGAVLFRKLIEMFERLFHHVGIKDLSAQELKPYLILFVCFLAVLFICRYVSQKYAPSAAGHGIPEIIEAVNSRGGVIKGRVGVIKTLLSALTIGVGGSCGSEGPIALIGASIASKVGGFFKVNSDRLKILTACGAASGIAATFNAPLGGFMFAVEVILLDFGLSKVAPIIVSTIVASVTARQWFHGESVLKISSDALGQARSISHDNWMLSVLALGIFAGVISGIYVKLMDRFEIFFEGPFKKLGHYRLVIVSLLFVALVAWQPRVLGVGYDTLNQLFSSDYQSMALTFTLTALALIVLTKLLATALTLGSGGSGGVFSPALFIGAASGVLLGALFAETMPGFFKGIEPTTYGIIGMGAVVSGALRAPITGFLITYELNRAGNQDLILPLMLACIVSTLVSRSIIRHGIFTVKLSRLHALKVQAKDASITQDIRVEKCMIENFYAVPSNMSLKVMYQLSQVSNHHSMFYVLKESKLEGVIPMHLIRTQYMKSRDDSQKRTAGELMVEETFVLAPDDDLEKAIDYLDRSQHEELPVIEDGKMKAVLTYNSAMAAYNKALHGLKLMDAIGENITNFEKEGFTKISDEIGICEIDVPGHFVNKKVMELDLMKSYKVQILMIKNKDQMDVLLVSGDMILKKDQRLVLMGKEDDIKKITRL